MKTNRYAVVIRASVVKTIEVEATDEQSAIEQAHEEFSVLNDGPEHYEQDLVTCEQLQEEVSA